MPTKPITELGGEIFLVADLQDFPTETCTFSLWTQQTTRLFYGNYDTGSSFEDLETFLDMDIQSGGMELSFAGTSCNFSGDAYPLFRMGEPHHLAITLQSTPDGYTISCYANAVLVGTQTLQIVNGNNQPMRLLSSGPLYIGNRAPDRSQDGQFGDLKEARGSMSEVHLYRQVLSAPGINLDALGEVSAEASPYLNLPLDDLHHDLRRGMWLDTVKPYFHAREYVRSDNNPRIDFEGSFSNFPTTDRSVAFWIRCSEKETGVLISYGDVSNSDHPNDGGSQWILEDPTNLRLGSYSSGLQLGTGSWNHVAIVEDSRGRTTMFYLNGQPGPNPPANYVIDGVIPDQLFLLGARQATDANDTVFTGDLVELRFWSRCLSANEVAEFARGVMPDPNDASNVYYNSLGATGVQEDQNPSNTFFSPILTQKISYPLLSSQAQRQVLHIGPDTGAMQTLAYQNLSGVEFSLEFWAKITTDGYIVLGRQGVNADNVVNFSLARQGEVLTLLINDPGSNQPHRYTLEPGAIVLSEWHHLAITISTTAINGYLDGQEALVAPVSDGSGLPSLDQLYLQFGGSEGEKLSMEGDLAEIRLWNRALPVGEVRHRMYHFLVGNEFGLSGRWAFENSLGRDTSGNRRHAFPIDKPEFTPLSDIDLEPLGSPYLVAQVSLMEDYQFAEDKITTRNAYRVIVTAYDEGDRPLSASNLSISIQAEPNSPFQNASVLTEYSGKTEAHSIAINQPYVMATNSQGVINFALPAEDLLAPVLRITAPFMAADHALLIFPDRQAHHQLAQVTPEALLNKKVVMTAGGDPVTMISEAQKDSAPHIAQAIRHFMGVATEKSPQSNAPVVRPVQQCLREIVDPPQKRLYENATASPHAYNSDSDVISGYATVAGQSSISRSLSVNQMPSWSFDQTDTGMHTVREVSPGNRTRNFVLTDNLEYADDFTRLLLTSVDGRKRGIAPSSYADLLAAIDQNNRTRSFFDIFTAIKEAASFVVHTVEQVYETVKETIRVAVVYVTHLVDDVIKVTAFAIHGVEHAVEAVKGVLAKVGATIEGAINFVKVLFDWDDILETQQFNEQLLMSVMASAQSNLKTTKASTLAWAEGLKATTHDWLEKLKTNAAQHKSSIQDGAVPSQRTNVKGSYVQNMAGTHLKDATLEGDTNDGLDPTQSQVALDKIHNDNTGKVDHIKGALANLHLVSGTEFSLGAIVDRLIDMLETIADSLFDLMIAGLEWFFDQLELLLKELDKLLAYRIDLPLLTRLYEEVIMKNNGSKLTLYSLAALLGAIPATIIYKLATGSDHGPFHGEELSRYRNLITAVPVPITEDEAARARQLIEQQKASLGLGGCFLGFIAITGVYNTMRIAGDAPQFETPSLGLKRIGFALNGVFQLTQFPLGSTFTLLSNPGAPAAATEESIWAVQFFPVVLEGIAVLDKLSASKAAFEKFSGLAITVFGGLHAALFITVFGLEMSNPESDKEDSAIKFVSNLASCIPELTVLFPPHPVARAVLSAVASTAWGLLSLVRIVNEAKAHHSFSPR